MESFKTSVESVQRCRATVVSVDFFLLSTQYFFASASEVRCIHTLSSRRENSSQLTLGLLIYRVVSLVFCTVASQVRNKPTVTYRLNY